MDSAWLRPFVATGQLALTLYLAHVVLGMGVLEAIGRLKKQTLPFALLAALVFCIMSVVFAQLWRKRFKRGPLEAIMRTLTGPQKPFPQKKIDFNSKLIHLYRYICIKLLFPLKISNRLLKRS